MRQVFLQTKKQGFILGLLAVVGLAFLIPEAGAGASGFPAVALTKVGVSLVFFFQGLSLPTRELGRGITQWKLHLFIQFWILIGSAIVFVSIGFVLSQVSSSSIHQGFYFLALLPTTISSAVAFTANAEGNISSAIFNTTLSNVVGVFWVPVLCLYLFSAGGALEGGFISGMLMKLSKLILLPMLLGQVLRPFVKELKGFFWIKPHFKTINNFVVLYIIYVAFCRSVSTNSWTEVSTFELILLIFSAVFSVGLISFLVLKSARCVLQTREDIVAGFFCGSQKTLAAGVPIAAAIFADANFDSINLGILLIPLLCYHPTQLFLAGVMVPQLSRGRGSI